MRQAIATVKKTKEIQEKYKVFTKKSFGQNFIIEPGIVEKIANAAIQSRDELVFEIGPGIGALTQFLCEKSHGCIKKSILAKSQCRFDGHSVFFPSQVSFRR